MLYYLTTPVILGTLCTYLPVLVMLVLDIVRIRLEREAAG